MKKEGLIYSLLCISTVMQSTWRINQVVNNSDLEVVSASYTKPVKKKIDYLSKKIKQAEGQSVIKFDGYNVHQRSKGCSRIDLSNGYYLVLDGPSATAIKWERIKANKKSAGKNVLDLNTDYYAARVFLEHEGFAHSLTSSVRGYQLENMYFDIVLSGSNGHYVVRLK